MTRLVNVAELETADTAGWRLQRLEIYNWGTFDQKVWTFDTRGENALLTGDIGSGKSTIVDAITTLLLPANRISYNKAAGAEVKERSLRSYVLGYHKSERNEETGASRPVALRDRRSFSAILGVFANAGFGSTVSLAQIFWFGSNHNQPDRCYIIADKELAIAADFTDFGGDIAALKRRLRHSGARVHDHFPPYGKDFRRQLGIESDQAMELFHQTVSMKSVGNLNDFVRNHMLEPFDADVWTKGLVDHFEDLTRAHDAVRKARDQLTELKPLLAECDAHGRVASEIASLKRQRDALRFYCADRKAQLLTDQVGMLIGEVESYQDKLVVTKDRLRDLRIRKEQLALRRVGLGGNRLAEIDRLVDEASHERDRRQHRFTRFHELLDLAGLEPVDDAAQFAARRAQIARETDVLDERQADLQNELTEVGVQVSALEAESKGVNAEILSLKQRRSNIPKVHLDVRERLCGELHIDTGQLPFAGELIQVRPEWRSWEGAAERVLHGFALSMLVSGEHYTAVSDWINDHHLDARLVYFRVPERPSRQGSDGMITDRSLFTKLEIRDSPFHGWLERELMHRADYECVDTMDDFRRAAKAVTRAGQIKGVRGRHEKNDVRRIDDRRYYVLGWDNEAKIDALLAQANWLQRQRNDLEGKRAALRTALVQTNTLRDTSARLAEFSSFADIDWQSVVNRITELTSEKRRLEHDSDALRQVSKELDAIDRDIAVVEHEQESLTTTVSRLIRDRETTDDALHAAKQILDTPECEPAREFFPMLDAHVGTRSTATAAAYDRIEREVSGELSIAIDRHTERLTRAANKAASRMREFRTKYPLETADFDDSILSADEYREFHARLVNDDLPRFETEFKTYLNTNTIRDIAGFSSELNRQVDLIRRRIDTINQSLIGIDYNPGRYIRLQSEPTINVEIREFRTAVRDCTTGAFGSDDSGQYSERKFLQVKRIVERFKGRVGQTEDDRKWTKRVTDVRNWFMFSAAECWRADDTAYEHYTDSSGKSGGQKEKLAYTILAASLAYQFKLDSRSKSKTFRFVVIDEAFGRGSDESTRFALGLFQRVGLQLLIVTPLQKIHVIEPYVSSVGFVDNKSGSYSRLHSLTIEEYHQQQRMRALQQTWVAS